MTDDLNTLRPEVREALIDFDSWMNSHEYHEGVRPRRWFKAIRAELLRLTRENAEFRRAWDDALLTGTGILKVERIDPATLMLPVESRQEPPK